MKKILFVILFLVSCSQIAYSQEKVAIVDDSPLSEVLKQLDLKETDIDMNLYAEEILPHLDFNTIMIIPVFAKTEIDSERMDAYILIIDNTSGKILNQYYEPEIQTELPWLIKMEIDTVSYTLNNKTQAFGIRLYYSMVSRVNPYIITELSLFVPENKSLLKILNRYPVSEYMGEVYDNDICLSWFKSFESTITVDKNRTKGFYDLLVKDVITSESDCNEETTHQTQRLQYNGSEYPFKE